MNREDRIYSENTGSPERVFQDHQKLKDAIWEIYSEALKAAQEQDIILPPRSSRRTGLQKSKSPSVTTETNQTEDTIHQAAETNSSNTGMEINTNSRSISPQLSELLDLVITMESDEYEEDMEISPSNPDTESTEVEKKYDISNSTVNAGNVVNSHIEKNKNKRFEFIQNININQNYPTTNPIKEEEKEEFRLYSKRLRLPGIEQVINKTSFANQRSDYYNPINASDCNDALYGMEVTQKFSNLGLLNSQTSPTISASTQENSHYSYLSSFPGRSTILRQPGATESFSPSSASEKQSSRNSPLLNPALSKSNSWPFARVSQGTSLTSPQAVFQNYNTAQREVPGMLGLSSPEQSSPYLNNTMKSLNSNQYQKYKTLTTNSCVPIADSTPSPQMENIFPPNAMVTRSDLSSPFQTSNRPTLVKDDYLKNHHPPAYNSLISSPVTSSKPNQTIMQLGNVNTQKLGLGSTTPSPTFSPKEPYSSHGTINSQGVQISPTAPPNLATNTNTISSGFSQIQNNFLDQQNSQYSRAGPAPARQEFMQHLAGQMGTNPAGLYQQYQNYGAKNQESITQQRIPAKNKSQWSGSYGKPSNIYKSIKGIPAPISSTRVQDYSSPRSQEVSSLRGHDLPSPIQQQFTSPYAQQYSSSRAQEFPYPFNQRFRSSDIPSMPNPEFPSQQGQFKASHPELHSLQYPQRISASNPSTSAMEHPMLNVTETKRFGNQDGVTTKAYSQLTTTKAPRKRRVTKGISAAQTKRIQKKRKQVEDKLYEYLSNENCDQKTSVIISKQLYHVQSCPNWFTNEDCPLCNQICEMLVHSVECQSLNCPFIYCGIKALSTVAEYFSDPKFVYGFLKLLNISEEEMKDIYVIKNWKEKYTADYLQC